MAEKCDCEPSGECTLDRYRRDIAFYRSLPTTPVEYRNEKALADIMLGDTPSASSAAPAPARAAAKVPSSGW